MRLGDPNNKFGLVFMHVLDKLNFIFYIPIHTKTLLGMNV